MKKQVTQESLKKLFDYKDGHLWRKSSGKQAGTINKEKYRRIMVHGNLKYEHQLVFIYHHGYCPDVIDHIDNNAFNNAIENLREATVSENQFNSRTRINSFTNIKNVTYLQKSKKYRVTLGLNKTKKHFGYYDDPELAELVAIEARDKYHGRFARHG
jgi:hypothetical protein